VTWILHGIAPDGSSWGYTDPLGQTWWASTNWPPRPATVEGLRRYAVYAGWALCERTFEGPDAIVAYRHAMMAYRPAEGPL